MPEPKKKAGNIKKHNASVAEAPPDDGKDAEIARLQEELAASKRNQEENQRKEEAERPQRIAAEAKLRDLQNQFTPPEPFSRKHQRVDNGRDDRGRPPPFSGDP